jgi:hypothetical protein
MYFLSSWRKTGQSDGILDYTPKKPKKKKKKKEKKKKERKRK